MKKRFFLFVLLLLLVPGCEAVSRSQQNPNAVKEDQGLEGRPIEVAESQVYRGNLILVNKDYPLHPEGIKSDLVNLSEHRELLRGYELLDHHIRLSQSVAQEFLQMVGAAGKDKVHHLQINSGYRDNAEQSRLYKEMGSALAMPAGASEHNSGLALDIGSALTEMEHAPEGKWLQKNAWKYGFILRYPKDKSAITGIQYEPWHFRYVGLPHSAIMQKKDLTLEQYLEYIKEQKTVRFTLDGGAYEVSYYPVSSHTTVEVPVHRHYELSGDNMDGVIVTVFPGSA